MNKTPQQGAPASHKEQQDNPWRKPCNTVPRRLTKTSWLYANKVPQQAVTKSYKATGQQTNKVPQQSTPIYHKE